MADLSTISDSNPADGEAVSQGASRIRAVVDATQNSFNVEHALAGAHAFINGAPGLRPTAGTNGRIFIDTTNNRIERDTGSAWTTLRTVQPYYVAGGAISLGTGSFSSTAAQVIDCGASATVFVVFVINSTGGASYKTQVLFDSTVLSPGEVTHDVAVSNAADSRLGWAIGFPVTSGSHTITVQGQRIGTGSLDVTSTGLTCFVC